MAKLSPKQKKIAAKAGDPNKIEGADFAKIRQEKEGGAGPIQMSKVGYTMQYGKNAETDTPTTFRTDAVMRMAPMLMTNGNKPVDTSSYSADTSSAYSTPSFQGSEGQNYASSRTETTSTDTEVIPGEETTNTRLSYQEAWDQNIIEPGYTKGVRDRYEAKGLTFEDYAGGREEQRKDDPEGFEADMVAKTKVAGGPGTSTTKTDDQTIQTTKTDVDQSPQITDSVLVGKREQKYMEKTRKRLINDQSKMRKALEKAEKKYGTNSPEYRNAQKSYQGAIQSLSRFEEGRSQGATTGGTFKTGLVQTDAQTDFENQQKQKQSGESWRQRFEQDAARLNSRIGKGLGELSSFSNLGMPGTTSNSDFMSNIFGTSGLPTFGMIKPMQFRAQGGGKASRTAKSKSGGLNRKNNY